MKGHGEKLTRKEEQAIAALIAEPTLEKAASRAGVSTSTIYRWLQDEGFQEAYRASRREVVNHAITRLQRATTTAVSTLEDVMRDATAPASARVSAARAVLEMAVEGIKRDDTERRITELERILREGRR